MERERQFPTGIGYGVAVPHGKTPALRNLIAVAGTGGTPGPYEAVDGEPGRLFFLLAGPESQAGAHVKALSRISRLVRREPIRARLLAASDAEEFYRILVEAEGGGGAHKRQCDSDITPNPSLRPASQGARGTASALGRLGPPEPRPRRNR